MTLTPNPRKSRNLEMIMSLPQVNPSQHLPPEMSRLKNEVAARTEACHRAPPPLWDVSAKPAISDPERKFGVS